MSAEEPSIPELSGGAAQAGVLARLKRHKGAVALGLGAFLGIAFIGILLLPPIEEGPAAGGAAPPFGQIGGPSAPARAAPTDPSSLIRGADLLVGSDAGAPISGDEPAGGSGAPQAAGASKPSGEAEAAAAGPAAGAGSRLAARSLASLGEEKGLRGGRGGSSSASSGATSAPLSRAPAEGRGPLSVARRRLAAAARRAQRAGAALMGLARGAFGGGSGKGFNAGGAAPSTFGSSQAPGAGSSTDAPGGGIGGTGEPSDSKSTGGPARTPLAPIKAAGPAKEVKPSGPARGQKCALVKGLMPDFRPAVEIPENVNRRYHSTGEDDEDLTVPLMKRTHEKMVVLNAVNVEELERLKKLDLSCSKNNCKPLEACREVAVQSIGSGGAGSIAGEFKELIAKTAKGTGTCAPRAFENAGAAAECFTLGLESIRHDRSIKLKLEQHMVLLSVGRDCKVGQDGKNEDKDAANAKQRVWNDFVREDLAAYQKVYDYMKEPWCSGSERPKCGKIRLGKLRQAREALARLQASGETLAEFMGEDVGYVKRIADAHAGIQEAIRYHEGFAGDEGRNVFHGVRGTDKAAIAVFGLDEDFDEVLRKCGFSHPG